MIKASIEDPDPTYQAFLESSQRAPDNVGRRGLYEHGKNRDMELLNVVDLRACKVLTRADPQTPRRR